MSGAGAKELKHKVVLLGASGVGKSNIVLRYYKDQFVNYPQATIGSALICTRVTTQSGAQIVLEIWDTAGQERFSTLVPLYYRGAHSAIIVYDITNRYSFDRAKDYFLDFKRQSNAPSSQVMLVGNKTDLEAERAFPKSVAVGFAEENGIQYRETSAKSGEGVHDLFTYLVELHVGTEQTQSLPGVISGPASTPPPSTCWCSL
mmetsp:Transcript_11776/g.20049  ORF Transcript_11776/g.20049 Transcript_11776/m.20049 type:complete len:203 (+) Transcript_11776:33-641(+)